MKNIAGKKYGIGDSVTTLCCPPTEQHKHVDRSPLI